MWRTALLESHRGDRIGRCNRAGPSVHYRDMIHARVLVLGLALGLAACAGEASKEPGVIAAPAPVSAYRRTGPPPALPSVAPAEDAESEDVDGDEGDDHGDPGDVAAVAGDDDDEGEDEAPARPAEAPDRNELPDEIDRCPDAPEDVDGFDDTDGCPEPEGDVDRIGDGGDGARA